jgi:crotonobetainyl-CoA:carnitine CoA-transferase CaiB-like acyl-CoA transferase
MEQVLSGIRVLDLTRYIAGPYCSKLLADYGAEVIKVEKPGEGDPARRLGPFLNDEPHPDRSGLFLHLNTNKKSITLNIKSETGRSIVKDLVEKADILVESFRPALLPSLGLGYETLAKTNPKLVMTSISNFGQTGPYRDFKGSELIFQGFGGLMYQIGWENRQPMKKPLNVVQFQLGLTAALATMIAFLGAEVRGYGDHVDVNGVREQFTNVDWKAMLMVAYQYNMGLSEHRPEKGGGSLIPCKDGYVRMMVSPMFFERVVRMVGLSSEQSEYWQKPEVVADPLRLAEFRDRILLPWVLERTVDEIVQIGQAAGMMVAPFHNIHGVVHDPHLKVRQYWIDIEHPVAGKIAYPGAPIKMDEGGFQIKRPAPLLGQDNIEVYGMLGYNRQDLVRLREAGVI